ncbi:unnamed protein product [Phyllotreta striolata]|uniref:C2H2-type domain-containing protein n=1 Tax=Phyllotreta striolata TaxID=444603 RepID=A0A9P0DS92_PHYSR|nr:unnamed protein product [Phyllotreta striolata]
MLIPYCENLPSHVLVDARKLLHAKKKRRRCTGCYRKLYETYRDSKMAAVKSKTVYTYCADCAKQPAFSAFKCEVCGKSYKSYPSLWRHKKHECCQPKSFMCKYCRKMFRQRYDVKVHVRNIHPHKAVEFDEEYRLYFGAPYLCRTCGKSYKAATSLRRHVRVECGKTKNMLCMFCDRRFYYKQELQCHMFNRHKQDVAFEN